MGYSLSASGQSGLQASIPFITLICVRDRNGIDMDLLSSLSLGGKQNDDNNRSKAVIGSGSGIRETHSSIDQSGDITESGYTNYITMENSSCILSTATDSSVVLCRTRSLSTSSWPQLNCAD